MITFLIPETAHNIQISHYWKFRITPKLVFYHVILCAMIASFAVWFCYLKYEAIYILIFCSVFINICFYDYSHITPLFLSFDFISLRFYYQVIAESAAYILRKRCLGTQFLIRFQLKLQKGGRSMVQGQVFPRGRGGGAGADTFPIWFFPSQ